MILITIFSTALSTLTLNQDLEIEISSSQIQGDDFTSQMTVNGVDYLTICDCTQPELVQEQDIKCAPNTIILTEQIQNQGASQTEIQEKLETNYTYVNVIDSSFRCLDGRITSQMLGAPGGDAGQFILALLVYEQVTQKALDKETIEFYFQEYLECMEPEDFYWCNDDISVDSVETEMEVQGIDIQDPKDQRESELLELLVQPDGVGDLHIKNMLLYPELYSVNKNTIETFIGIFYEILWDKESYLSDLIFLEVLPGDHNETAFLEIRTYENCQVQQVAPLVIPRDGNADNLSVFVHHLDAVKIRRRSLSVFFVEKIAKYQDGLTVEKFYNWMQHNGLNYMDITGQLIAGELPFYSANFIYQN